MANQEVPPQSQRLLLDLLPRLQGQSLPVHHLQRLAQLPCLQPVRLRIKAATPKEPMLELWPPLPPRAAI